jgi:hypothetical protein
MPRSLHIVLLAILALPPAANADVVIGGFDTTRGGCAAVAGGSCFDSLRAVVTSGFPGATFVGSPTLTPAFLAGVDVLILGTATGATSATTPLSAAEVAALQSFVATGGAAIITIDNDTFAGPGSDAVNESFIDWLGLDATGTGAPWPQSASTVAPVGSPIANGPFGLVTGWTIGWTGWFDTVPAFATIEATINQNGAPGIVSVPRHALAACSGPVVVFADSTTFSDGFLAGGSSSATLLLNALAWATESPCAAGLCGDINGDGSVNASDLAILLGAWGGPSPSADLDASGTVDASDLAILLGAWGEC